MCSETDSQLFLEFFIGINISINFFTFKYMAMHLSVVQDKLKLSTCTTDALPTAVVNKKKTTFFSLFGSIVDIILNTAC